MNPKSIFALIFIFLMVSVAQGATWELTIQEPASGDALLVAIGEEVQSLEGVRVRVVGSNKVGGYSCDGQSFPELLYLDGTFGEPGDSDDMLLMDEIWHDDILGSEFDVIHEFDLTDSSEWVFLEGGTGEFTVSWWRVYPDPMGYCTHLFSSFRLDSITLSIDYNGAVPVFRQTWGTLKANFRD